MAPPPREPRLPRPWLRGTGEGAMAEGKGGRLASGPEPTPPQHEAPLGATGPVLGCEVAVPQVLVGTW